MKNPPFNKDLSDVPFPEFSRKSLLAKSKLSAIKGNGENPLPVNSILPELDAPTTANCSECRAKIESDTLEFLRRAGICRKCYSFAGRVLAALDADANRKTKNKFFQRFEGANHR